APGAPARPAPPVRQLLLAVTPGVPAAAPRDCAATLPRPVFRSRVGDWAMGVPGRGLRRAAHGCAAAASQPWMADRAEEQPPARDAPNRRPDQVACSPTPLGWEWNQNRAYCQIGRRSSS